jgi:hypothetical protein
MIYKSEPWMESAACLSIGTESFFPEIGEDWHSPRRVCNQVCTVRLQCLDLAMRTEAGTSLHARAGLWGGLSPLERKRYEAEWLAEQEVAA